jgi:hypothetical protein
MRLLLLAGSLALALAAVAAASDPDPTTKPAAPSAADATPPAPAAAPPAPESAKKPVSASSAEAKLKADAKSKADPKKPAQNAREIAATQFKQCVRDWDAATHMTRKEWERTCRRVVDARAKFMLDQMGGR